MAMCELKKQREKKNRLHSLQVVGLERWHARAGNRPPTDEGKQTTGPMWIGYLISSCPTVVSPRRENPTIACRKSHRSFECETRMASVNPEAQEDPDPYSNGLYTVISRLIRREETLCSCGSSPQPWRPSGRETWQSWMSLSAHQGGGPVWLWDEEKILPKCESKAWQRTRKCMSTSVDTQAI